MKKYILLIIFFLSNIFSIQGMMTLRRSPFARWQGAGRQNVAKSFVLQKSTSKLVSRPEAPSPLSTGIQKRFYSSSVSSPAPKHKQAGFWNWISSFFAQKSVSEPKIEIAEPKVKMLVPELETKGLERIIHELLYPQHTKKIIDRGGITRDIRLFDENDLERAKEKIDLILKSDEKYKKAIVLQGEDYSNRTYA